MNRNKKGNIAIIAIIIVIIAITIGAISWLFLKKSQAPAIQTLVTPPSTLITKTEPADKTTNWQTYRNDKYGFSLDIPKDWATKEMNGNYTSTIRLYAPEFTPNKQFEVPNIRIDIIKEDPEAVQISLMGRGEVTNINGIEMHKAYLDSNFEVLFKGKETDILYYIYFCAGKEKPEYYKNILEQILPSFKFL